ncbi:hypothetical protein K466DRAFT_570261, partial [Polyporus arcularius HHB13444]
MGWSAAPLNAGTSPQLQLVEVMYRLKRLEEDGKELRDAQAESRPEIKTLRELVATMSTSGKGALVAGELEDAVRMSVNGTHALLPGENAGEDHIRDPKVFHRVKNWTEDIWNRVGSKEDKGATTVGEAVGLRGRAAAAEGKNKTAAFIENVDGTRASSAYVKAARDFCREFIVMLNALGIRVADLWKNVDPRIRAIFFTAIRKKFALFQLCDNNYKANLLMQTTWYDTVKRKRDSAKKTQAPIKLDDAQFTFSDTEDTAADIALKLEVKATTLDAEEGAEDTSDDDSEAINDGNLCTRRAPKRKAQDVADVPAKRVKGTVSAKAGKAAKTTTVGHTAKSAKENARPGPSSAANKGKEKERVNRYRFDDDIYALIDKQQTAATAASPAHTKSIAGTSAELPASESSAPSVSATTVTSTPPGRGGACADAPPLEQEVPTTSVSGMAPVPATQIGSSTSESADPHVPESKPPRPQPKPKRRKASTWPPTGDDLTGSKWDYAREWYAKSQGNQEDFESHYRLIDAKVKRKMAREWKK